MPVIIAEGFAASTADWLQKYSGEKRQSETKERRRRGNEHNLKCKSERCQERVHHCRFRYGQRHDGRLQSNEKGRGYGKIRVRY